MSAYRFSPKALTDLSEIWSFIANDDPSAADRVEAAVYRTCSFLSSRPLSGSLRRDLTKRDLRFFPVQPYRNYLIVYDPDSNPLNIVRILHGARSLSQILK